MIGVVASAASFFLVEAYLRKTFIPFFFPAGRLAQYPKTIKIPIRRRIRVLYMSGTSVPMMILMGTLGFTLKNGKPGVPNQ